MWWTALALAGPVPLVVGGSRVAPGTFPDVVGVVVGDEVRCSGVLIAPDAVLTAAHCVDADIVPEVVVGSVDWTLDGDWIAVRAAHSHPDHDPAAFAADAPTGPDVAVLLLERASLSAPRWIVDDCLGDALDPDDPVTIVGFGNTLTTGGGRQSSLNAAETLVVDPTCAADRIDGVATGCAEGLRPTGELIAGGRLDVDGDGLREVRDTCVGDSGGPLYAWTPYGVGVVGITSRGLAGADVERPCGDGGIYVRPAAVLDWITATVGSALPAPICNTPPMVEDPGVLVVDAGDGVTTTLSIADAESDVFDVVVLEGSPLGTTTLDGTTVTFTADRGVEGSTSILLEVADRGADVGGPRLATEVRLDVRVSARRCGCQAGGSARLGGLLLISALLVRRRA